MKNKLKLIIIIFFLSLIVSGCELNYNLTIKDDRDYLQNRCKNVERMYREAIRNSQEGNRGGC